MSITVCARYRMGKRKRNAEEAAAAPEEEAGERTVGCAMCAVTLTAHERAWRGAGEHGASDAKRKRAAQYHCNYCNAVRTGLLGCAA